MFNPLNREDIKRVVEIQFQSIVKTLLQTQNIKISASNEAIDWLAQIGYDPQFGARPVKRVMQKKVLNELSRELLAGKIKKDDTIVLDVFDTNLVFRKPVIPKTFLL